MKLHKINHIRVAVVAILISFNSISFSQVIDWNIGQKIVASDRSSNDLFGWATAISGNTAMIGAYGREEDSAGLGNMPYAGLVHFFNYDSLDGWTESQRVNASDRDTNDWFGRDVAISGNYAIVGAPFDGEDANGSNFISHAGSAYILERNSSGIWQEVAKIAPTDRHVNDQFGRRVDINGDYAIIGAHQNPTDSANLNSLTWCGAAYIFKRDGSGNWTQWQKIHASSRGSYDIFGSSVALHGEWALVGAMFDEYDKNGSNFVWQAGAAHFFKRNTSGKFIHQQKVTANVRDTTAQFGYSVSIYEDYAIVGADYEDFDSLNSNEIENAGAAYVFKKNTSNIWNLQQKLSGKHRGTNYWFGEDVDIDSDYLVAGSFSDPYDDTGSSYMLGAGSVNLYKKNTSGHWVQDQKMIARHRGPTSGFGRSTSISGKNIVGGMSTNTFDKDGNNWISNAGAAYIFGPCFTIESDLDSLSICQGDSTIIFGTYRSVASTYTDTFPSYLGCDSIASIKLILKPRPTVTSVTSASRCGNGSVNLAASVDLGNPLWYSAPSGGLNFFTGTAYTTPNLSSSTTYYIGTFYNGCASNTRTPITATINTVPSVNSTSTGSTCDSGVVTLTASSTLGNLSWYTASSGGTSIGTGSPFNTPAITSTTPFYVEAFDSNCTSTRTQVMAFVYQTPSVTSTTGSSICDNGSVTLMATVSAGTLKWYSSQTGGTVLGTNSPFNTPVISATTSYYVEASANGCQSVRVAVDAVVLKSSSSTISESACLTYISPSGKYQLTESGTYNDTISNAAGCDSILTINLVVTSIDTTVTQSGVSIKANDPSLAYQWIDCDNDNTPISGATNQSFVANSNGHYAVILTENNCSDTSRCVKISTVGISENKQQNHLSIYPNPTSGSFILESTQKYQVMTYRLLNSSGQLIEEQLSYNNNSVQLSIEGRSGLYLLKVTIDDSEEKVFRIIKSD